MAELVANSFGCDGVQYSRNEEFYLRNSNDPETSVVNAVNGVSGNVVINGTTNEIDITTSGQNITASLLPPSPAPTAGTYNNATVTVDALGRVTAASSPAYSGGFTYIVDLQRAPIIFGGATNRSSADDPAFFKKIDNFLGYAFTGSTSSPPVPTTFYGVVFPAATIEGTEIGKIISGVPSNSCGSILFTFFFGPSDLVAPYTPGRAGATHFCSFQMNITGPTAINIGQPGSVGTWDDPNGSSTGNVLSQADSSHSTLYITTSVAAAAGGGAAPIVLNLDNVVGALTATFMFTNNGYARSVIFS